MTADEWIRKHVGRRVYDVVWGPLLRGKFGEEYYRQVAMPWFWGKIQTRFASRGKGLRGMQREKLGYPIGSFGEVFDVLGEKIRATGNEVHISSSVSRIVVENGRARGLKLRADGEDVFREFDTVLTTTPSYILSKLVSGLPEEYLEKLSSVDYLAAVLLILVLKRPISHIYWLNIADRSIPFVGLIEHTNLIEPEHYAGKHIAYLSNYLSTSHPLYKMSHEDLLYEYLPHLRKINPEFDSSWIEKSYHHRVDAAQPIVTTKYSQKIPEFRTPIEGLYLANTTQIYPEDRGTNYSVRMGKQVARMIMRDMA